MIVDAIIAGLIAAGLMGAALGFAGRHRRIGPVVGAAIGLVLVVFARRALSNAPLNDEGGDLSHQNVVQAVGYAVILLYTAAYGAGAALRWLRHNRRV